MYKPVYIMRSIVWLYPGMVGWHFVNLGKSESKEIKNLFGRGGARGFGSIPVKVTIGNTRWKTAIFPDTKTQTHFLPLKAQVRKQEKIVAEKTINFQVEIAI